MESLSVCLSSSSPLFKSHKTTSKTPQHPFKNQLSLSSKFHSTQISTLVNSLTCNFKTSLKPHLSLPILMGLISPYSLSLPSFAAEIADPSTEVSDKINIESILLSIDDFFNRYPYFVAGVTFIWLIVIPVVEEFLKKYKFLSAINAFGKLRDDSSAQLLDIRDEKSLGLMGSPSLRMFNKDVAQVTYTEGDEDGFLKKVMEKFGDPSNTVICILDNFDGNSIKVAELLVKNGFKEAYAIKGGVRGEKGWKEIQEELLPPSVHVYPNKKGKKSQRMNSVQ